MKVENFGQELGGKINKYVRKYNNKYEVYFRTIFYCLTRIFNIPTHVTGDVKKLPEDVLRIAIRLDGGLGDVLVYSLWVKEFSKIIESDFLIDVFPSRSMMISKAVFKENTFINKIYNYSYFEDNVKNYDLAIEFRRFPHIVYYNYDKIKKYSPNLNELIYKYNIFQKDYDKFFINGASCDTLIDLYSVCRGEKRIQQPDIDRLLGIDENTKLYLPLSAESFDILDKYDLKNTQYITITRSVDQNYTQKQNVRLWPIAYYEELIKKMKQKYPEVKLVQLGVSRCEELRGIDVNLLGKTTLEEVKAILKHSLLHIDGECGMVHTKHFLYGKSAVFFGQTAIEYLGYENNINLKSDGCPHWCEWIVDDWQTHCIRGYDEPPCMTELKPDYVFENIVPYLDSVVNKPEKQIEIQEVDDLKTYFENNVLSNKKIIFYGREFYDIAKNLVQNNNQITIYDSKLDNKKIKEAKELGISMDYGDIYNIPEDDDSCDLYILNVMPNNEFAANEIKRVANKILLSEEN